MTGLTDLPAEVQLNICDRLGWYDLSMLRATSKHSYKLPSRQFLIKALQVFERATAAALAEFEVCQQESDWDDLPAYVVWMDTQTGPRDNERVVEICERNSTTVRIHPKGFTDEERNDFLEIFYSWLPCYACLTLHPAMDFETGAYKWGDASSQGNLPPRTCVDHLMQEAARVGEPCRWIHRGYMWVNTCHTWGKSTGDRNERRCRQTVAGLCDACWRAKNIEVMVFKERLISEINDRQKYVDWLDTVESTPLSEAPPEPPLCDITGSWH